ncbi:MAG: serine/threonine-protein kinase [Myxococcota bacterium]|jgi:serine/threonine-protein kinase|nr:serine/threonine-protein kinase [Myxococcota bacterium]
MTQNPKLYRTLRTGEVLCAQYRIESIIGDGGSGIVYAAHQLEVARPVVIKTLLPNIAQDEMAVARFQREAALMGKLNHPNVVTIYDFVRADDLVFIAMERLDGVPLNRLLRMEGALEVERVARLLEQILSGLAAAHAIGIVHRDLKPGNIFVSLDSKGEHVKLIDFGIAKEMDPGLTQLTTAGVLIGTPGYMAPELIAHEPVSPAADIYSAGIVAYEMLTGKAAYPEISELMRIAAQGTRDPAPPAEGLQSHPLWRVIDRMYARDPLVRYSCVKDVLEDVAIALRRPAQDLAGAVAMTVPMDAVCDDGATQEQALGLADTVSVEESEFRVGLASERETKTATVPSVAVQKSGSLKLVVLSLVLLVALGGVALLLYFLLG